MRGLGGRGRGIVGRKRPVKAWSGSPGGGVEAGLHEHIVSDRDPLCRESVGCFPVPGLSFLQSTVKPTHLFSILAGLVWAGAEE